MNHVVKSGDTLIAIARRNRLTLNRLLALNPEIDDPDLITIGQAIRISAPAAPAANTPAPTPAPAIAMPAAIAPCDDTAEPAEHIVLAGDTLGAIARTHGLTLARLLELNPDIDDPDLIQPGQRILLAETAEPEDEPPVQPAAVMATPATVRYTVTAGDTLGRIAARHHTTVAKVLVLNPQIIDPDVIHVGQVVRLPGIADVAPAAVASPPPPVSEAPLHIDRDAFFSGCRNRFRERFKQSQVDGLEFLLGRLETDPDYRDIRLMAYFLATVRHEAANRWQPITEFGDRSRFDHLYDPVLASTPARRRRARRMGNTRQGDGFRYRGRGYVQLTWKSNYRDLGRLLGIDLVSSPERVLEPDISYDVTARGMKLGLFTGRKLGQFINDQRTNYNSARQVVNGCDRHALIAGHAKKFEAILEVCL